MLEENAKILAKRFPLVLDRILKQKTEHLTIFSMKSKMANILMIQRGEHAFPVYGTHAE